MQTVAQQTPYTFPTTDKDAHPPGLHFICAAVGAERFSFFLLSSVLVLYLNEHVGLSAARAVQSFGLFLCVSYLAPLIGGRLCDGNFGSQRTALYGALIQGLGYAALLGDSAAVLPLVMLLLALGSGLFKAGSQSLMANLYTAQHPLRARGFSHLYVAINVGALAAPIVGGVVQKCSSWGAVFAIASLGALASVGVLILGQQSLAVAARRIPDFATENVVGTPPVPFCRLSLLLLAGVVFTAGAVQSHSSLLLWVRDRTDCSVGGVDIPVAWFAGAPSALVLLIAPLLTMVFARLQRVQREPSVFGKIMLGFVVSCLAAVPVWIASVLSAGGQRTSVLWVLLCLAMLATSELLVLALAPSELTRLAPTTRRGRWLSYWFVAQAIGNLLGGWLHF